MTKLPVTTGLITLAFALSPVASASAAQAPQSAEIRPLLAKARLSYERFTLANGLRVIIHTDRKAPVVAVSVWYDIGSKQEPKGKTGFAHLFEHLMFNGSENSDGDWSEQTTQMGATGVNGQTGYDATRYYETVPVGALERTLFLESDRMGFLLGAVTQRNLTSQIGVVKNEKRQRLDNQAYGQVYPRQTAALFSPDHPYGHIIIGSMADLDSSNLNDVKQWFRDHYGPNNAVLVLSGDIDAKTAKPLVQRYFGDIPRGPQAKPVAAPVPTLKKRTEITLKDRVPTTRLYRTWVVPGLNDPDAVALDMGASVLGGLASSRLDNALVRDEQLAVQVSAGLQSFAQMSQFEVTVDVKPGADPVAVGKRLDQLIAEMIAKGPTRQELNRVMTQQALAAVNGLQTVNGKATRLAEGELYSKDPNHFAADLAKASRTTPAQVRAAMAKWLGRPVLALTVEPGARDAYVEAPAVPVVKAAATTASNEPRIKRGAMPEIGQLSELAFPAIERTTLANGIEVTYARRENVPLTQVAMSFDAGFSADAKAKLGVAAITTSLLKEGTATLSSKQIAERQEELGASIGAQSSLDRTSVGLTTLSSTLSPSLDLMADIVQRPAFAEREFERLRTRQLASIASEQTNPQAMASRTLGPILFGPNSPYGVPGTGSGTVDSVKGLTRADVVQYHDAWLRPEKAKLFVVSDLPLAQLKPLLEARFGTWAGQGPAGSKAFGSSNPVEPRIILIDRKDSPQSQIAAVQLLDVDPKADILQLEAANDVLGGSFLSRINMDLRETKGWSYGVGAGIGRNDRAVRYQLSAPVQADKTGESIAAMIVDYREFLSKKGVTAAELERTVNSGVRELPGSFETNNAVLSAIVGNDFLGRPDDYYERLPARYRALTAAELDSTARSLIDPSKFLWLVVGDAAKVRPQLQNLGLKIEEVTVQ